MSRASKLRRTSRRFTAKAEAIFKRLGPLDHAKLAGDQAMKAFTLQAIAARCEKERAGRQQPR